MTMMTEDQRIDRCVPLVVSWCRRVRRMLPWRLEPTPYRVWISEIMLQQTRIEAVLGYYERFLAELPTVEALAACEDDRLLKLWEGLGYYSRARNLKKAARQLVERHGGRLPGSAAELKKLPGIGAYTAGAIASIAFGQPEPAVDGNVLRVLSRVLESREDVGLDATRKRAAALLRAHYPTGEDAALLTEGLMELGETLCIPNGEARCELCPLRGCCLACEHGTAARLPVKSPPRERRVEERTVLLLRCGEKYAVRRRPARGLLAGLWEFPALVGFLSAEETVAELEKQGAVVLGCEPCGEARHLFTHVEWRMRGYRVDCAREWGDFLWRSPGQIAAEHPIPTALRYFQRVTEERP